jgi:hypothetical protein
MDTHFVLADSYARSNRNDLAFSALPDAPVLPYTEPRHRVRGIVAHLRDGTNRLHVPMIGHRQRHSEACS